MIGAVGEAQAEHLGDVAADDPLVVEAGQLEGAAAAADHATGLVADEERGVGRRGVVVEQLEQEPEPALRARLRLPAEARRAVGRGAAVAAVGADEEVGHGVGWGPACPETRQAARSSKPARTLVGRGPLRLDTAQNSPSGGAAGGSRRRWA